MDTDQTRPEQESDAVKHCWDKIVEGYKARLTLGVALTIAMVTLTGYALQTGKPGLFLASGAIPILIFAFDLLAKWHTIVPFLYKAFSTNAGKHGGEPLELLFLDYASENDSRFVRILAMPPGAARQAAFRRAYVLRHISVKAAMVVLASAAEVFLWFALK